MNLSKKIALHFNVSESNLVFSDEQLSHNSCTVIVNGKPFDVWFDERIDIRGSAPAV